MENSKIEWTDHTFNPWIGCKKVSLGCQYCYAEAMSNRYGWAAWGNGTRKRTSEANWRKPFAWNRKAQQEGQRKRVFCASLADVFEDNDQIIDWRLDLFEIIAKTPWLDWLLLTKRPEVAARFFRRRDDLLFDNVWMGASVENQQAVERAHKLHAIDARILFYSCEPLLEAVDLDLTYYPTDWVIVGGESGPGCRPFNPDWARSIRDECAVAGIPFFMKQLGGHPNKRDAIEDFPDDLRIREFPTGVTTLTDLAGLNLIDEVAPTIVRSWGAE